MSSGAYYVIGGIKGGKTFRQNLVEILGSQETGAPRVLYLGAACDNNLKYKGAFESGLYTVNPQAVLASLSLSAHIDYRHKHANPDYIGEQFGKADVVFFDGGGIEPLREVFNRFGLNHHLRTAYARGAYIGGLCGGGSYLAEEVVHYEGGVVKKERGAGLIAGTAISCHMNLTEQYASRLYLLKEAVSEGSSSRSVGLASNQTLLFSGHSIECLPYDTDTAMKPFVIGKGASSSVVQLVPDKAFMPA